MAETIVLQVAEMSLHDFQGKTGYSLAATAECMKMSRRQLEDISAGKAKLRPIHKGYLWMAYQQITHQQVA